MSFDSALKKAAVHPFGPSNGAVPKSVAPPPSVLQPTAASPPAAASSAQAKTSQALSSLFGFMTDTAGAAKAAPQALAKQGPSLASKAGSTPVGASVSQAAPSPQKAEQAAKMAAQTLGKASPPDQKVALAAKMAAKATHPEAPSEQRSALKEKLAEAVKAAPDGKKEELAKKVATATAEKDVPFANRVAHFAPNLRGGAPASAQAPLLQSAGAGPDAEEEDRKILEVDFKQQEWGHWCGPASTRIALSARMDNPPSQQALADQLGTHGGGTDHIGLITSVLNDQLGTGYYENKLIPGATATDEERDLLWKDIVTDIDNNYPIVANIVAPPSNHPDGYPDDETIYHYVSIIGYDKSDQAALVADPAKFNYRPGFQSQYWMGVDKLADLIARKGYSA